LCVVELSALTVDQHSKLIQNLNRVQTGLNLNNKKDAFSCSKNFK
jgi:hypothetical protein